MIRTMAALTPTILGQLFDACAARLVLYARQWGSREQAQDVAQEAFIKLMTLKTPPENPKAWLYATVRNATISNRRSATSRQKREQVAGKERSTLFAADPMAGLIAAEASEALATLAADLRETLTLRIWGELTFAEIATVTDTPLSTVHHRYHEALASMRARLEKPCRNI